jgi:hypothetical protein
VLTEVAQNTVCESVVSRALLYCLFKIWVVKSDCIDSETVFITLNTTARRNKNKIIYLSVVVPQKPHTVLPKKLTALQQLTKKFPQFY